MGTFSLFLALLGPGGAMAQQRLAALTPRTDCSFRLGAQLPRLQSPTGLELGAGPLRFYTGAVVANGGIVAGVAALMSAAAVVLPLGVLLNSGPADAFAEKAIRKRILCRLASTRAAQLLLSSLLVLMQPTLFCAWLLVLHPPATPGLRVVGGVAVCVAVGAAAVLLSVLHPRLFKGKFAADAIEVDDADAGVLRCSPRAASKWLLFSRGEWRNEAPHEYFGQLYGPLFWDYVEESHWYMATEFAQALLHAAVELVNGLQGCYAGAIVGLIVVVLFGALFAWRRPFARRLEQGLSATIHILFITVASCNVSFHATGYGDGPRDVATFLVAPVQWFAIALSLKQTITVYIRLYHASDIKMTDADVDSPLPGRSQTFVVNLSDDDWDTSVDSVLVHLLPGGDDGGNDDDDAPERGASLDGGNSDTSVDSVLVHLLPGGDDGGNDDDDAPERRASLDGGSSSDTSVDNVLAHLLPGGGDGGNDGHDIDPHDPLESGDDIDDVNSDLALLDRDDENPATVAESAVTSAFLNRVNVTADFAKRFNGPKGLPLDVQGKQT
jgi:hypothetical protein